MSSPTEIFRRIIERVSTARLSELLSELLILANQTGSEELEKWVKLEVGGYFRGNSALTEDVVVPEYRTVAGQYSTEEGTPLIVRDPGLKFINEYRLRNAVAELERLAETSRLISIEDPTFTAMLREQLRLRVRAFNFTPGAVVGVLAGIRTQVLERLNKLRPLLIEDRKSAVQVGIQAGDNRVENQAAPAIETLHPTVVQTASALYRDGHYRQAILDTYIALVHAVKQISGRTDLDNTALMQTVFSPKNPLVVLSNDSDEQMGYMWMLSGAVMGIRNPKAHRLIPQTDPQRTFEWLAFASVLFRVLDSAIPPNQAQTLP